MNSALVTGTFGKSVLNSDLRRISQSGEVSHFQFGLTNSNDRSVLSMYPRQINNLQIGHAGPGFLVAFGDVAPSYSSLSSMLGVRGGSGQYQLGKLTVNGYSGVVAESWEALEGEVLRNQFLRNVNGAKLEYAVDQTLKVYATGQSGVDKTGSISNPLVAVYSKPSYVRSHSAGFQYANPDWQLGGETAESHFEQESAASRAGRASLIDGTWRKGKVSMRAGYHEIDPKFVSLSAMVAAGITESYLGGDWTADDWITLSGDLRNTENATLASSTSASTITQIDSSAIRANINFGQKYPGWGLTLQSTDSVTNMQGSLSRLRQDALNLSYASQFGNLNFGYSLGMSSSKASPSSDANTDNWNLGIGRNFSNAVGTSPPSWTLGVNLNAALQQQHPLAGGVGSRNASFALAFSGQRVGWGQFSLSIGNSMLSANSQTAALKQRELQFEASHPFSPTSAVKMYIRNSQRNVGNPTIGAIEHVAGIQLNYQF